MTESKSSKKNHSNKDDLPYIKYLNEGNKKFGDHKGAHNDMVQFGFHLESDYMIKLLKEKIKENSYFNDEFILLISSSLNAQELKVITNRFGLVDGVFRTQREVGEFLGITPQRVSQIELKATKKIQIAKSLENLFERK